MNELNDWFPEGENAWGDSSITGVKMTEKDLKEYYNKREVQYQEWLKNNQTILDFEFIKRAFNEGVLK